MWHKTKAIKYNGEIVDIDVNIVPLMSMMWELGINTTNSCQGHCRPCCKHSFKKIHYDDGSVLHKKVLTRQCHKYIWIVFDQATDIEKFYDLISEYDDRYDSMYAKMHGHCYKGNNLNANWIVEVYPVNLGENKVIVKKPVLKAYGKKEGEFVELYETVGCDKNKFNMMIQLWFPIRHLSYVEKRLKLALSKH